MTATFWTAAYLPHRQLRNETEVSQIVDIDLICRIGSLEMIEGTVERYPGLICRIGSLEKSCTLRCLCRSLICRIGSLEILARVGCSLFSSYLPHRQLRNEIDNVFECASGDLPYRQLRNATTLLRSLKGGYLPYRQLRNDNGISL